MESIQNEVESRLTQRAADWDTRHVFRQYAWLEVGSGKAASPRPVHPPVKILVPPRLWK